jgi:hypothetical protein
MPRVGQAQAEGSTWMSACAQSVSLASSHNIAGPAISAASLNKVR